MLATTPGWIGKVEVVEVSYDPEVVKLGALIEHAKGCECTQAVFTRTDAQQKVGAALLPKQSRRSDEAVRVTENKYYLSRTPGAFLPLTPAQAARANVYAGKRQSYDTILSPAQTRLLRSIEAHPKAGWRNAIGIPLTDAWTAAQAVLDTFEVQPDAK